MPVTVLQGAALVTALGAVVWDLASRRIPNVLTFGAAVLALLVRSYMAGWSGAASAGGGWLVGVVLFVPFFALGGMGAGDVKLLAALGAWLGPAPVIWVALFTGIAGGVMALGVALYTGYLKQAFANLWCMFMVWRTSGLRPVPDLTLASGRGPRLAYAVPVFAGLVLALWWQR
jgi:prepilin peptidase CpaA